MKKIRTLVAVIATAVITLTSCSGSGAGSDKNSIFGSLPSEYSEYMAERAKLKEKGEKVTTEAEKAELIEKGKKLDEKWSAKLEKAAREVDGKEINITDSLFKVTSPISLTFEKLNGSSLAPRFKINGSAENAELITVENTFNPQRYVYLAGYDAQGNQLFRMEVGKITGEINGTTLEIQPGTPVDFSTLKFYPADVDKYPEAKTYKLIV